VEFVRTLFGQNRDSSEAVLAHIRGSTTHIQPSPNATLTNESNSFAKFVDHEVVTEFAATECVSQTDTLLSRFVLAIEKRKKSIKQLIEATDTEKSGVITYDQLEWM
jgi:hypothetical protein